MKRFFCFQMFFLMAVVGLMACARTKSIAPAEPAPVSSPAKAVIVAQPEQKSIPTTKEKAPQLKKPIADKKVPAVIDLGAIDTIESLGSFQKLTKKTSLDPDYEKLRIEYLLERLSKTAYNFLRNGETHDSRKAVLLMRYKWTKFNSEVKTAEDFAEKIAAGSRHSGEPYYVKAHNRFYLVKDILFYELEQLKKALLRYNER